MNFFQIQASFLGGFDINDIAISENGKYQTLCGGANIAYSLDFGYNWISSTICADVLVSITMSKNGKYQSVCGLNDNSNSVMYSKNYGCTWKYSNLSNSDIQWKSISSSSCGQYQTLCSYGTSIIISDDFGINWIESLSGAHNWCLVYVTYDGQRQLACEYGGDIYLSLDFGYTWNSCYTSPNPNNWKSISVSGTLQFIDAPYNNDILTSKINGEIPGFISIPTKSVINDYATILLSGNNSNIYSYEINNINSFNILSSNIEDSGNVSYSILDYGPIID